MDVGEFSSEASILSIAFAWIQDLSGSSSKGEKISHVGKVGWAGLRGCFKIARKDQKSHKKRGFGWFWSVFILQFLG